MMKAGKITDQDGSTFCARGLEYRTPSGAQHRQLNKINAWDAVLDEQDRQWQEGVCDADALAQVYIASSSHCLKSARQIAMNDERIALQQRTPLCIAKKSSPRVFRSRPKDKRWSVQEAMSMRAAAH